jgi:hypothetical protein
MIIAITIYEDVLTETLNPDKAKQIAKKLIKSQYAMFAETRYIHGGSKTLEESIEFYKDKLNEELKTLETL